MQAGGLRSIYAALTPEFCPKLMHEFFSLDYALISTVGEVCVLVHICGFGCTANRRDIQSGASRTESQQADDPQWMDYPFRRRIRGGGGNNFGPAARELARLQTDRWFAGVRLQFSEYFSAGQSTGQASQSLIRQ